MGTMTKEIWATVIVAIAQIIASVLIAWWQIVKTTQAAENDEKNQEEHKMNLHNRIFKYLSKKPLHIIIPLIFYVAITAVFISKQLPITEILIFIACWLFILMLQMIMWWIINAIQLFAKLILKHESRLKCHESILFDLTDKPCKDDGVCKFEV